jgi:thioredoxin 1
LKNKILLSEKEIFMGKEINVSDKDFDLEVLQSKIPVFVDFWAPWCAPCKMVGPAIEEIAQEYDGKLKVCKLNVDDSPDSTLKYEVRSIPTFIIFKEGKEVKRSSGATSKEGIVTLFKDII